MEVYIPYIAVSTLTSFLGGITYKYYNYDEKKEIEESKETEEIKDTNESKDTKEIKDNFNYDIIEDNVDEVKKEEINTTEEEINNNKLDTIIEEDEVIKEEINKLNTNINNVNKIIDEKNNNTYLGRTRNQKMDNIRRICRDDCNIILNSNNKKCRNKLIRYIKEYENKGHLEFILKYNKV